MHIRHALGLQPHPNPPFHLGQVHRRDPAVELGEHLIRYPEEPRIQDLETLSAPGLPFVHQTTQSLATPRAHPLVDRCCRDAHADDLALVESSKEAPVNTLLEGGLLRHRLDALPLGRAVIGSERIERFARVRELGIALAVPGEDLQHHLLLEQRVLLGVLRQAVPPWPQRGVRHPRGAVHNWLDAVQEAVLHRDLLAQHVPQPHRVPLDADHQRHPAGGQDPVPGLQADRRRPTHRTAAVSHHCSGVLTVIGVERSQ